MDESCWVVGFVAESLFSLVEVGWFESHLGSASGVCIFSQAVYL